MTETSEQPEAPNPDKVTERETTEKAQKDKAEHKQTVEELNDQQESEQAEQDVADREKAQIAAEYGDTAREPKGVVATEEMFRARFVPQAFYLSDRFKNTWKECMAGFNAAKDPGEMVEELFWGFIQMAPKMAIAYSLHLDDQEINRKRAAQDDKEDYDKQLLLMKGLSPADYHKLKCDWVFGSEELHQYLKEHQPDLPRADGYVNIDDCNDAQKTQIRKHVENFIKENPYYKNMIENFTHREFAQDEINREAAGMVPAIFHLQGKPQNLTRNGVPVNGPVPPRHKPHTPPLNRLTGASRPQGQPQRGPLKKVAPINTDSLQQLGQNLVNSLQALNRQMQKNGEILASIQQYQHNGISPFQPPRQQTQNTTTGAQERQS